MMTWAELNEVRDLNKAIEDVTKEIDMLHLSLALKIPERDGMPKAKPLNSRVERIAIRITDAENKLAELKKLLEDAIPRLENKIRAEIKDTTARTLFIFRYIDCMYFLDIGFAMGYSERHIYYLHKITGEKIVSDWY